MENVVFKGQRKTVFPNANEYVFKISDGIADLIREYSNYPDDKLLLELNSDNEYIYRVTSLFKKKAPELNETVTETITKISNMYDEEGFWNKLLTDDGKHRCPSEVHDLMENEYGIDDEKVEWWVAHFFIGLSGLMYSPEYD